MSFFSNTDMAELRNIHDSALFDTCVPQTRIGISSSYGSQTGGATFADGADPLPCLFIPISVEEAGGQVQRADARILLARGATVSNLSRIKMTHLHGDKLTPALVYEVVGGPEVNHAGVEIKVRLVTDGSGA